MPQISDDQLVEFLKWALPKMGYRWEGFRKVRSQVKSRISNRLDQLGMGGLDEYRRYLNDHPDEWERLDEACYITISRFYRDRTTWDRLRREVLPELADAVRRRGGDTFRALSLGAASGEEPYTLRLCWEFDDDRPWRDLSLRVDAIDAAGHMVRRAKAAVYPPGNLKKLPDRWVERAFESTDGERRLCRRFRRGVDFEVADLREFDPAAVYELVFCRNLAFIYFDAAGRKETLSRIADWIRPGGALVVGKDAKLPDCPRLFARWPKAENIWRRQEDADSS